MNQSARPTNSTLPVYKWWVVLMLWLVCFFSYADRQSINSVRSLLQKEFALDEVKLGLIGSVFAWVYAMTGLAETFHRFRSSERELVKARLNKIEAELFQLNL